jgi:ubiquinone/menaquinone biosynthesis C-methylase UbiE
VGFYSRIIFPRLCELALNRPEIARRRRALLQRAGGRILEIGLGTGLNLPCYPRHVRRLITVDVNPGMQPFAQRRSRGAGIAIDHHTISGERLPFADRSFDCVVSTFTLCSIDEVDRALAEIHRVLVPGGRLLFLEHGLSREPAVQTWQRRLNWIQRRLGDGCRLDRPIDALIAAQPFVALEFRDGYLEGVPRTHGYLYDGLAIK